MIFRKHNFILRKKRTKQKSECDLMSSKKEKKKRSLGYLSYDEKARNSISIKTKTRLCVSEGR